jgi:hypothetical protein
MPIAQCGLNQSKGRDRGRIGAQNTRTERHPQDARQGKKGVAFLAVETAFRADQNSEGTELFRIGKRTQSFVWIFRWGVLVAENEKPVVVPVSKEGVEPDRWCDFRDDEDAALLGGFDGIGQHAFGIDSVDLGPAGQHGAQQARPHFDSFLDHIILPRLFQGCEKIMKIGVGFLRPRHLAGNERDGLPVGNRQGRFPFAIAAVEHANYGAFGQAQHIADIICLCVIEIDPRGWRERDVDIKPVRGEIIARHAATHFGRVRAEGSSTRQRSPARGSVCHEKNCVC